jgi:hypothetical protein
MRGHLLKARGLSPHLFIWKSECQSHPFYFLTDALAQRQQEHTEQALAWIQERFDRCLAAFASPGFAIQISTDEKRPEEIVEEILTRLNSLAP